MKTIKFQGHLAELYPDGIRLAADSAAEAISGLQNFPGFRRSDGVFHQVRLPDFQSKDALYAKTDREVIEVVPVTEGAGGKAGIMQIIIGVVLIVVAVYAPELLPAILGPNAAANVALAGALMVLGGVMQMLMPQPTNAGGSVDGERSNYLPATGNTVRVGTPIPLLFGRFKVFGHILSFDIDATNLAAPTPPAGAAAWSGYIYTGDSDYGISSDGISDGSVGSPM